MVEKANKYYQDLGLTTRVVLSNEGKIFNPAYMDATDSYAVLGSADDVKSFIKDKDPGIYEENFSNWFGGAENKPERAETAYPAKADAIGLDSQGIASHAKELGLTPDQLGAFLTLHAAGHNAMMNHSTDSYAGLRHPGINPSNAAIMVSGNHFAGSLGKYTGVKIQTYKTLDDFLKKENNSKLIEVMKLIFGNTIAQDNYNKNQQNAQ